MTGTDKITGFRDHVTWLFIVKVDCHKAKNINSHEHSQNKCYCVNTYLIM